jgi:hypothetical protein
MSRQIPGESVKVVGKFEIRRLVVGHAYARNGNVGHETERVIWPVYFDGAPFTTARTLREARQIVKEEAAR